MSWFSKWFRNIRQRAENIWATDVAPAVKDSWELFSDQFSQIALDAVTKLAMSQLSGGQKFETAVKEVLKDAKTKGWNVGSSAVQLLVQRAYVNFKASNGDLTLDAPAP